MKEILDFLSQLARNNNREWFAENKAIYESAKVRFEEIIEDLLPKVKHIDGKVDVMTANECIFRIFRDVRFSKDKNPYKINFGAYMSKGGKKGEFAGYYLHIQPGGESFIGAGVYAPSPPLTYKIRHYIEENGEELNLVLNSPKFKSNFEAIQGDKLKNVPRTFDAESDFAELLKHKNWFILKKYSDSEIINPGFQNTFLADTQLLVPFNRFFNDAVVA